jgi:hypothetical protein
MTRPAWTTFALRAMMSLLTACGAAPDAPTGPSSAVVTPPAPTTGIVQGLVKHEAYVSHGLFPEGPLSSAQVVVTEGPGAGHSVTPVADGADRFDLPPGPFRVRWSAPGYEPRDSDPGAVIAGSTTTVNAVILQRLSNAIGDWSITGIVRDGVGNPVAGARINAWDGVAWFVGDTSTDAAGRFVLTPKREHPSSLHIDAWKDGYRSQSITVPCVPSCAITADFRLLRVIRQWLDGPATMQVGDVAPVTGVVEYDDGTRYAGWTYVESTNLGVVQVLPSQLPFERLYVKAIAPGAATLQRPLATETLILNVHVVP